MSDYTIGQRVRYTGKGRYSLFKDLEGREGTVTDRRTRAGSESTTVQFDREPHPISVYTDNLELVAKPNDVVAQPKHYTQHPSGVECITITQHMGFNLGNVIKYVWRADLKGNAVQDLEKAAQYLEFEIARLKAAANG